MAIKLQLRNPDGTYTRGSLKNAEKRLQVLVVRLFRVEEKY